MRSKTFGSLQQQLEQCDREIAECARRAMEENAHWVLGAGDWEKEKEMILREIETMKDLNEYAKEVHAANAKWWVDLKTGEPIKRNVGELLMLCTSELAEALEGHRKDLMDDKLPHRKMFEVELADCVIRIFDICAGLGLDLEGAYQEKMAFNAIRKDHTREGRLEKGGKAY